MIFFRMVQIFRVLVKESILHVGNLKSVSSERSCQDQVELNNPTQYPAFKMFKEAYFEFKPIGHGCLCFR
ncbi:hypothetical protein JHK82_040565 [Glycine max]|uniref:Uncharacterized protein n=2 Tax=Glycine subgen. Soja TaxID=1462606 RepID=K7M824_SOYBN|nr:hypothetical protein JHK86_040757 [Glycine max]RZB69837.1 hypothetical protein D0Y65_039250 [Glycine soja]KAG4966384.1 hypothetical protein JHK85_041359 [Glycine max]KAG5111342.1 hypothetical protein JHK82_040565 [Glycine max]KAH1095346.1 hypothetical protein GYH30_040581 [Glycine max]